MRAAKREHAVGVRHCDTMLYVLQSARRHMKTPGAAKKIKTPQTGPADPFKVLSQKDFKGFFQTIGSSDTQRPIALASLKNVETLGIVIPFSIREMYDLSAPIRSASSDWVICAFLRASRMIVPE